MSQQFKDNFSKDGEEDMLQYDDSAFYYFSFSLISFLLIPFTYNLLKSALFGDLRIDEPSGNCQSA